MLACTVGALHTHATCWVICVQALAGASVFALLQESARCYSMPCYGARVDMLS